MTSTTPSAPPPAPPTTTPPTSPSNTTPSNATPSNAPPPGTTPAPNLAELVARSEFEAAQRHYDLGRFQQAVAHYTRAYEAMPLPPLLFNIAQCHRHLRQPAQAAFFYRRYLDLAGEPANAALTRELLAEMERHVHEQERLERQRALASSLAIEPRTDGDVVTTSGTPLRHRWWVWAIAGGVAAAGAAAVGIVATRPTDGTLGTVNAR